MSLSPWCGVRLESARLFVATFQTVDDSRDQEQYKRHKTEFPVALVWSIFKDIAEALLCLRSALTAPDFKSPDITWDGSIIHGDLKPDNFLLGPASDQKTLDVRYPGARLAGFGLSVSVKDSSYNLDRVVGTPGFIPPENQITPNGDFYGLGGSIYAVAMDEVLDGIFKSLKPKHGPELRKMVYSALEPDLKKRTNSGLLVANLETMGREMRSKHFECLPYWAYPHDNLANPPRAL